MESVLCSIHLVALTSDKSVESFLQELDVTSSGSPPCLLKGRTHGWVHRPHHNDTEQLLGHDWDLFLLTHDLVLPVPVREMAAGHVAVQVSIPKSQYDNIASQGNVKPKPRTDTPPLPGEWRKSPSVPRSLVIDATEHGKPLPPLQPGELRLDHEMAKFLSSALPKDVKDEPVSLMNLFKYPRDDSSVHEHYMQGFKKNFGDSAGATVKFMGPVQGPVQYGPKSDEPEGNRGKVWQDANLVQYDSIWHYAYMLSTEVYQELNKEKMDGVEDTCILLVSEVELAR